MINFVENPTVGKTPFLFFKLTHILVSIVPEVTYFSHVKLERINFNFAIFEVSSVGVLQLLRKM